MKNFSDLNINTSLIKILNSINITKPSRIQQLAIPTIMEGFDIIAQAKTGSGKTLSFILPILEKTKAANKEPKVLIITPTRELCEQISTEIKRVSANIYNLKTVALYGGISLTKQVESVKNGVDIIVGTPGRLNDILFRKSLDLSKIETLVLDEADIMLDMGFGSDVRKIIDKLPTKRQTLLFSATYQDGIQQLAKDILNNAKTINAELKDEPLNIKEFLLVSKNKQESLLKTLQCYNPKKVVIFCNTKTKSEKIYNFLHGKFFDSALLNGNLEQSQRDEMLLQFANNSLPVLIATDLASRGLDIENIDMVINYDSPLKKETYIHRIGRTARADASGVAITICKTDDLEKFTKTVPYLEHIELNCKEDSNFALQGQFVTLKIDGGKRKKVRAGDILGTLCKDIGIDAKDIGKIDIFADYSYVAVSKDISKKACEGLQKSKIKKRKVRVWML